MEIIMSKFKVGDEVLVLDSSNFNDLVGIFIKKGNKYKVAYISDDKVGLEYAEGCYARVDVKCVGLYKTSNRNKLREHIKSLGFTAIDLSVAAGFNKYYFGTETAESKFNKRGDISDDRFCELEALASSAFATLKLKQCSDGSFVDNPKAQDIVINNYGSPFNAVGLAIPNSKISKKLTQLANENRGCNSIIKPEKPNVLLSATCACFVLLLISYLLLLVIVFKQFN